jgi:cytochrome P450
VRLSGTEVPEGARVFLLFASANRDEELFQNGEQLDIHRPNAVRNLGFGYGAHHCVGMPLAKLEVQLVLEAMLERLPGLRLAPGERGSWLPNLIHRGPRQLQVEWDR